MSGNAFQDYWDMNRCWGCGSGNEHGLHLKSFWDGDESLSVFLPSRDHKAGPDDYLNGGIIATIIDCHSICTAIADAYRGEKRELNSEPFIWYVTASMKIDYHKPTPIARSVTLRAGVEKREGKKTLVSCGLYSDDVECARGEVLAVRVSPEKWFK
ncbi:MAG: thioesterase [Candidatus Dadabacteria bacterium RIFCSPHIGHO2_12_FULL_53_21]|nr:MAG: thioesterase [Candidatus Dadabacteria bacterium RIFCSPHIGHO2_12_FULL_53_21]